MRIVTGLGLAFVLALAASPAARAADGKIAVVAAENFYGDIARQIGGDRVEVVSIMNNPDQDPHLFETTPGIVRQIADARIVIFNGADYDPWMDKLLKAAPRPGRSVIVAAELVHRKPATIRICGTTRRPCRRWPRRCAAALSADRSRRQGRLRGQARDVPRLAQADRRQDRRDPRQICRRAGDRHRAGVRLYGGRARAHHAQRALSARHHERHRAERARRRRVRAGPEDAQGPRDVLQQAGLQQDRAASGRAGARRQGAGGRRDRDRAARPVVPGLDAGAAQRHRQGAGRDQIRDRDRRTRPRHHPDRRPQRAGGRQLRDSTPANSSACSDPTAPARPR